MSSIKDPRDIGRTRKYEEFVESDEADFLALLSLVFGISGLMMRYKLAAWLGLFTSLASITTMRKEEMDMKQILCSLL